MVGDVYTSIEKQKNSQLETTVSKKTIFKTYKKKSRKFRRRNKRKICSFKRKKIKKKQEIYVGLKKNYVDMDASPCDLPTEITEWQKQDQIAYWKSRAITLEIENRMLHQHIRDVYAQQYYEENNDWEQVFNYESQSKTKNDNRNCSAGHKVCKRSLKIKNPSNDLSAPISSKEALEIVAKPTSRVMPKIPTEKNRLKEMKKIYGKKAQKIMGMETAIQLNYDRLNEEESESIGYWPNTPLKLY